MVHRDLGHPKGRLSRVMAWNDTHALSVRPLLRSLCLLAYVGAIIAVAERAASSKLPGLIPDPSLRHAFRNVPGVSLYFLSLAKLRVLLGHSGYFSPVGLPLPRPIQGRKTGKIKLSTTGDLLVGSTARTGVGFLLMPATLLKTLSEVSGPLPRGPIDDRAAGRRLPRDSRLNLLVLALLATRSVFAALDRFLSLLSRPSHHRI